MTTQILGIPEMVPNNMKTNNVFTGTKLSSNFNVNNPVPFTKKHDVIY